MKSVAKRSYRGRNVCVKPLSHWVATVGDKLRTAFASEFPKCRRCSQFPHMSRSDSLTCRWNLRFFKKLKKLAKPIFSEKSRRVLAGVSNPSLILLNLVSVSQTGANYTK